eukprot:TRINITY_DN10250_c0_g1_i2.p1 TRINITY_DN10250_c0_g1~~TRINITY_DN10250_c0_g1_i2.p1  ORF type:complete len:283 (+),score=45.83 TRINITY_DN10250_c0_g1_i2:568-1416(+)
MCTQGTFECTGLIPISQPIQSIPCVDIQNCQFMECPNNCSSRGVCSSIGICTCDNGYYGFDCSLSLENTCLTRTIKGKSNTRCMQPELDKAKCNLSVKYDNENFTFPLLDLSRDIYPTCSGADEFSFTRGCEYCLALRNLTYQSQKGQLQGCPLLLSVCSGLSVEMKSFGCLDLVKGPLLCDDKGDGNLGGNGGNAGNAGNVTSPTFNSNNRNTALIITLGAVLALLVGIFIAVMIRYTHKKTSYGPAVVDGNEDPFSSAEEANLQDASGLRSVSSSSSFYD